MRRERRGSRKIGGGKRQGSEGGGEEWRREGTGGRR